MKVLTILGCTALVLALCGSAQAQRNIHPKKAGYKDAQKWPATKPGEARLKNFHPFRAVYERHYKQNSGPGKGQPREDRVILSSESVSWHGKPIILINIIDTANTEYEDTNARSQVLYVNQEDLSILMDIGPMPGKAKDYYIAKKQENKMVTTSISEDGKTRTQKMPASADGFGPGAWVMACMDLKKDLEVRLDPTYSRPGNVATGMKFARIIGRKNYWDATGKKYNAWVAEAMWGLADPKVSHLYLIDQPPYYLGTNSINLENGESNVYMRLTEFTSQGASSSNGQ